MAGEMHYIPKYLNAKTQFLWWEIDEAAIIFASFIVGRMLDKLIIFGLLGFILLRIYSKLKNAKQEGYLIHVLYALGLVQFKSNGIIKNKIPHFYIKYFVK